MLKYFPGDSSHSKLPEMIFNIQRFSLHDGQGIRTVVFFKGCPLRCHWCSNPESHSYSADLMYDARLCRDFRDCLDSGDPVFSSPETIGSKKGREIRIDRKKIRDASKYRGLCLSKALTVAGEERSTGDLIEFIEKDIPFYSPGGGVTLSGGEPLSIGESLTELLVALKQKNIDVAVETSLHVGWKQIERCIGFVGTFLADMKHTDPRKFIRYTGGRAGLVMDNLHKLGKYAINLILRIPVIPDFNHSMPEMKQIINFVATLGYVSEIHFLPYHTLGSEKYKMLGLTDPFPGRKKVDDEEIRPYEDYAREMGFITKIGG